MIWHWARTQDLCLKVKAQVSSGSIPDDDDDVDDDDDDDDDCYMDCFCGNDETYPSHCVFSLITLITCYIMETTVIT